MTLFGRMHRHPPIHGDLTPTTWIVAGLGLTSLLLAQLALRIGAGLDEAV